MKEFEYNWNFNSNFFACNLDYLHSKKFQFKMQIISNIDDTFSILLLLNPAPELVRFKFTHLIPSNTYNTCSLNRLMALMRN